MAGAAKGEDGADLPKGRRRRDGGTREKLRRAALALFVEKGVDGTSVRDIAHAAGVTEGALYRHYISKESLIRELFLGHYSAFAHRIADLLRSRRDFAAGLEALAGEFCRFFDEEETLFRFLLLVQHQALPAVERDEDNPVAVLQAFMAKAAAKGEVGPADPALATALLMGLLLQPATFALYGRISRPLRDHHQTILAACKAVLIRREE